MWGHTPKPGYTYYACRTRDRVAPAGHPAFICLDEDNLLSLDLEELQHQRQAQPAPAGAAKGPHRLPLAAGHSASWAIH